MNLRLPTPARSGAALLAALFALVLSLPDARAQFQAAIGEIIEIEGAAEISFKDGPWQPAKTNTEIKPGDRLRTAEFSRATVKGVDGALHRLGEMTTMRFGSAAADEDEEEFSLLDGFLYFFSRKPVDDRAFSTELVTAAIKGTEFILIADRENGDTLHMIEGEVELATRSSTASLASGAVAKADPAGTIATYQGVRFGGPIAWFAHYPAVLIPEELQIEADPSSPLGQSLARYRSGNLAEAVRLLQTPAANPQPNEAAYRAALAISVGRAEEAEDLLQRASARFPAVAAALRQLVSTIQGQTATPRPADASSSPSQLLAASYALQSKGELTAALEAARSAQRLLPQPNGLALSRESELLFSLGRYEAARQAASDALDAAPELVSAKTRLAFLHAATGDDAAALQAFSAALAQDPSYAEAWLGQGLMRFRQGEEAQGLSDIETAVALSPLQASYRAYLARLFMQTQRWDKSAGELEIAAELDPADPNIALVSALQSAAENDSASALRALRRSLAADDARSPFRSAAMLQEDAALRSANLAQVYEDADLPVFGLRAASDALARNPGSAEAHAFLAGAYENLQDPSTATLRYQSPYQAERLAYNLLAPTRAGLLPLAASPNNYYNLLGSSDGALDISVQPILEYGANARATYTQTGERHSVSLGGQWNYLDGYSDGWNFDRRELEAGFKRDLASGDTLTAIARATRRESTDPNDDPGDESYKETLPSALLGYRRAWNPEHETVAYVQYVAFDIDTTGTGDALVTNPAGDAILGSLAGNVASSARSDAIQVEAQHRATLPGGAIVVGARGQTGDWKTSYTLADPDSESALGAESDNDFERAEAYVYGYFDLTEQLSLIAGANATRFTYPIEAFTYPASSGEETATRLLPKLGLIWRKSPDLVLRAAYAKSLGGLALEDGYRLEPTQVAGFLQGYRTLMAEEIDGTHPAVEFDIFGAGGTYFIDERMFLDVELNSRTSSSDRAIGRFAFDGDFAAASWPSNTEFEESSGNIDLSYLIQPATTLSLGFNYTDSEIASEIPLVGAEVDRGGDLAATQLRVLHRAPEGLFASAAIRYLKQSTDETTRVDGVVIDRASRSGVERVQCDVEVGWRSRSGTQSVSVGARNLFDDDTRIDPINWTPTLFPRRLYFVSADWQF